MKLTRSQLKDIITDIKPDRFHLPTEKTLSEYVANKLNIVSDDIIFKDIIKKELYS